MFFNRIKALLDWLGDSARVALQKSHSAMADSAADRFHSTAATSSSRTVSNSLPVPAVVHVHAVAAVVWKSHEFAEIYNVHDILTKELLRFVAWNFLHPVID